MPQADIVFVHGLRGTSHDTWTHDPETPATQFFWPKELAEDLPSCRIWTVGYPAGITQLGVPGMRIEKRAGNLAHKLANNGIGDRPIVFVTHSMGGLIVKSLVAEAEMQGDDDRKRIALAVKGIVFCATPHRGSAYASSLKALGRYYSKPQNHVAEMAANEEAIDHLHDRFVEWHRKNYISLDTYAESRGLFQKSFFARLFFPIGLIVERASANPGIPGFAARDVDEDHLSIVKPKNRGSDVYAGVLRFIRTTLKLGDAVVNSDPTAIGACDVNDIVEQNALEPLEAPVRQVDLAVAQVGPDGPSIRVWVTALLVSDEADRLAKIVDQWREKLLDDPLQSAGQQNYSKKTLSLSDLAKNAVLLTRMLNWLATTHFSAYVYYAPSQDIPASSSNDELRQKLLVEPIAHRLSAKEEVVVAVHSDLPDVASAFKDADDIVMHRYRRRSGYSMGGKNNAYRKSLLELAELLAEATAAHLGDTGNETASLIFAHLRTRVRYAENVITAEKHTRDRNPLP